MPRRSIYLDHSATTPLDPRVLESMLPFLKDDFGNASSSHAAGRRAERALDDARDRISAILNCHPPEIIFTSGGTESDNLALRGAGWGARKRHPHVHLITTGVEHDAVIYTVEQMSATMGFSRTLLPVDHAGKVDPDDLAMTIQDDTALISIIYANNEVGTVQPIPQLAAQAHARGVHFHTDAVQAGGQLSLDVQALGVDLMSLSAHKFYGPKGVGLLFVRDGIEIEPAQSGGSQESYRRGGTYNVPGIVGMAAALELAYGEQEQRAARLCSLRDQLIEGVLTAVSGVELTGHRVDRLPSHASFVIDGIESNSLLMHLDVNGIMASSGSACKTGNPEPSNVLLAMGYRREQALGSLRLTFGQMTTEDDVAYTISTLKEAVERLRSLQTATVSRVLN